MARPINTSTRIGLLRSTLGLNAQDFAALAGISVGALRKIEAGFDTLSTRTTERLAYASGVDPDWLLGAGEDNLPLRLDLATGNMVPLTREDFEAGTAKNPTGPLNPVFDRMDDVRLLKIRAALRATERHGKRGAAYHVVSRVIGDMIEGVASTDYEAKQIRATFEREYQLLLEAETAQIKTRAGSAH
ncbi:MAG: helix-turn-helix transcriptional regulator [Verrucomicrobia bacterium]|nr:helix-turn-helix transcriptional regulator [Verrucomicrobiota bacterium]